MLDLYAGHSLFYLMKTDKAFNATVAGQTAMFHDATSRAVVSMLNNKVRALGGKVWADNMIATANDATLRSIMEDLLPIYNNLVTPK
jgi:hypothetical protein